MQVLLNVRSLDPDQRAQAVGLAPREPPTQLERDCAGDITSGSAGGGKTVRIAG
ncbi:MAG: hypothetical protein K0Q93_946 [Nocardioidaceae bacterium]|jgi:hypothetical protein|nr:hypothetical protein [Nocardioidaceae bacterium]